MAWYRNGTVTVTNGSPVVTGAGTDFVSNTTVGEVFVGPDMRVYEIAQVVSATDLRIIPSYQSASGGGQAYGIQPTQSFIRDLALNAATLLNTFGAVRDGIGQGLIGEGAVAAPGIRFAVDPDTGIFRSADNQLGIAVGGVNTLNVGGGAVSVAGVMVIGAVELPTITMNRNGVAGWSLGGFQAGSSSWGLRLNNGAPFLAVNTSGNLLVGTTVGTTHVIARGTGIAEQILSITGLGYPCASFFAGNGPGPNAGGACMSIFANGTTGASIRAGGTINASGADYAEYMLKAAGCGTIAPGDVCGVDHDGHLTRTWTDAVSFVVKSTDPAYVGGDSWGAHLPARPEAPGAEPTPPIAPGAPPEIEDTAALAAWREAAAAYPVLMGAYTADRAAWQAATDAYADALPQWEAALEAERVKVDRIAFCGQVPVNVTGDFAVGDYLIAAAAGAGIKAVAVADDDITFDQYRRRLGKVWAVRNGRAWVDVQHG